MEDVRREMALMRESLKGKASVTVDELIERTDHPFASEVMARPLLDKFKPPQMEMFNGDKDPLDHLEAYKPYMNLQVAPDKIMCRAFPTIIKGSTRVWFSRLKPGSISNFTELSQQLVGYFIGDQRHWKSATYLLNIKQSKRESLRDYMSRFNREMLQVDDANEKMIVAALMARLLPSKLLFSLYKNP